MEQGWKWNMATLNIYHFKNNNFSTLKVLKNLLIVIWNKIENETRLI